MARRPVSARRVGVGGLVYVALMTAVIAATTSSTPPRKSKISSAPGALAMAGSAGSAGTDTSLPLTDSAVMASGRPCASDSNGCGFQNLKITVNQTRNLVNQAVSVTWTGATATSFVGPLVYGDFLQIFQCWGEDDGTHPENPGPPPQNCEFGGLEANPKAAGAGVGSELVKSRRVNDPSDGVSAGGVIWKPFDAVDGTVVDAQADFSANDPYLTGAGGYWQNGYFNYYSTNEDVTAVTHPDGTGAELFTVDTGLEAPGLGCGQQIEPLPDGTTRIPKCWLVIVPRGDAQQENPPGLQTSDQPVQTSPMSAPAWRNRIAVPLDFNPVDTPCPIGATERRIVGSELATPAVTSWQPKLCSSPNSPPYNYSSISDDLARQQLLSVVQGSAGMAVMSRPIDPATTDPANPVVYAPLTLSGAVIGFNVERLPAIDGITGVPLDPAEAAIAGVRVAQINLTPRLVAKLLSESYEYQFGGFNPPYKWFKTNPSSVLTDPDFLQFNPEFQKLVAGSYGAGRLVLEQPTGDAAYEVWRWVLADPEARDFLAGNPDPWGMTVNPVYSTDPARNPSGVAFGDPIPNNYPKSEPYCAQANEPLVNAPGSPLPRPLCMLDIAPYANSMEVAALAARTTNDGAKATLDSGAPSSDTAWVANGQQPAGRRAMFSVTDSASAARYGLQTANLSRAGDDGAGRAFVAPDQAGLLAGEGAMGPSAVTGVLQGDPASTTAGAYPLTMLTYAAARPRTLDPTARADYAAFIAYAVGDGQVPGLTLGTLPLGYAPLPASLTAQSLATANLIATGDPASTTTTSTTTSTTTTTTTVEAVAAARPSATTTVARSSATPTPTSTPRLTPLVTIVSQPVATPVGEATPPTTLAATSGPLSGGAKTPPSTITAAPAPLVRTPKAGTGFVRFAVPIAIGIALFGFLATLVMDDRWQRALSAAMTRPSRAPGEPGGA